MIYLSEIKTKDLKGIPENLEINRLSNEFLAHYGVPGMRWGVRRFQKYLKGFNEKRRMKKVANQRSEALAKARQAKKDKAEHAKEVDRVLREGTATEVLKYKNEYTTEQLKEAVQRIDWTDKLIKYSEQEKQSAVKRIDKYMKTAKKVNDWVSTGLSSKKNFDEIMKLLDESATNSKKSKRKKKNREQRGK